MIFCFGGNKFVCNLCNYVNDIFFEYFCVISFQGVCVDCDQCLEFMWGIVEFVVFKEYWIRELVGFCYVFVIDVIQEFFNKGYLEVFCEGIFCVLYVFEDDEEKDENGEVKRRILVGVKVGFVIYDKEVYFYNVSLLLEQVQMMIMLDIEDFFVLFSEGLFVDFYEFKMVIMFFLMRLLQMFLDIKNLELVLFFILNVVVGVLEKIGGKIFCLLVVLFIWGFGCLFMRDDGKYFNGELDKKLFSMEYLVWRKLVEKLVFIGVGVDFFMVLFFGGYFDIVIVGKYYFCLFIEMIC